MLVVSDAGPLNYLLLLGRAELLPTLYDQVAIPIAVLAELTHPNAPDPVRAFALSPPPWLHVHTVDLQYGELAVLGRGEREAIELALSLHDQANFLLCDDGQARTIAEKSGIVVIGTLGVLRDAAIAGHINIESEINRLSAKTNFRGARSLYALVIAEVRRAIQMATEFTVHVAGDFTAPQIQTSWTDAPLVLTPQIQALAESAWREAASRPGVLLFDGPMVRLESWRLEDGRLLLNLGRTSYKVFYGTNLSHPELADTLGPGALANPLGLSAALESADGFLLFGRRNAKVAYYPNRVHPFAGSAESGDLFAEMRRELMEELNLQDAEIVDLRCIGLAEDRSIRQPELIFRVRSMLTREQIESRLDLGEHAGIVAIAATQADVSEAVTRAELTPIAKATLTLWSKLRGVVAGRGDQD